MIEIPGRFKITRATDRSRKVMRYAVNCVLFTGMKEGRPRLVATDGKILGVVPVRFTKDTKNPDSEGLIPHDAFDRAMAGTRAMEKRLVKLTSDAMEVRDAKGNLIVSVPRSDQDPSKFPAIEKAIPKAGSQKHVMRLVPAHLAKLTAVIGLPSSEPVALHFDSNEDGIVEGPIRVTEEPWGGDNEPHGVVVAGKVNIADRAKQIKLDAVRDVRPKELPTASTSRKKVAAVAAS